MLEVPGIAGLVRAPRGSGVLPSRRRSPVSWVDVERTLPYLLPVQAAAVMVMRLTAARPSEVLGMRGRDIDTSLGDVWLYRPAAHKTSHLGHQRVIALGGRARAVLIELHPGGLPDGPLFSPRAALAMKYGRLPRRRSRPAREQYDSQTFARAIARACRRAGVQPWSPYQLRHLAVTEVEVSFGVSAAKAVAGHKSYQATSIYTHGENELLLDIARKVG